MSTVTVESKKLENVLKKVEELKKELLEVKKLLAKAPPYGSDKWWKWSIERGLYELKEGKYEKYASIEDYIEELQKRV